MEAKRHFKWVLVIALVLWTGAATWTSLESCRTTRSARADLSAEAARHAETLTMLQDREDQLAYLTGLFDQASIDRAELKKNLNRQGAKIAELRKRKSGVYKSVIERVPADCESCLSGWRLPVVTDNDYRYCGSTDVFTEPLMVEIKPAYDRALIQPYEDAARACMADLSRSEVYHPLRLRAGADGFYGMNGQGLTPWIGFETGKRWTWALGVGAPVYIDPMGETRINPAAMIRLSYRLWPR